MAVISNLTNPNSTIHMTNVQQGTPPSLPQYQIIIQVTLLAILGAIIVLGNLACIVTFLKTQSLRRRCHYLIINLSFADFLIGVTAFMGMYYFLTFPKFSNAFLFSLSLIDVFASSASIMSLTAIALERFYAIYFPFRHRMLSFKFYMIFIAMLWTIALLIASFSVIGYTAVAVFFSVYLYSLFVVVLIALVFIIVSYTLICLKMRKNNTALQIQNRNLQERKLAVTLLIVTLLSLLTWLPYQLLVFIVFIPNVESSPYLMFIVQFLKFCNSGINVFVYIARMPEFRKAFLQNLRNVCQRNSEEDSSSSVCETGSSNPTRNRYERSNGPRDASISLENIQIDRYSVKNKESNIKKDHENDKRNSTQVNEHVNENTLKNYGYNKAEQAKQQTNVDTNDLNYGGIQNLGFPDTKETKF